MRDAPLLASLRELVGSPREAEWILEHVNADDALDHEYALALARRRAAGEPLQYLLGRWPFRTIELDIDARVLIPRPETEQVVERALGCWRETRPGSDGLVIVDLGCGSGAIGLSLGTELRGDATIDRVILTDRTQDALDVASANAQRLGVGTVIFRRGSWFGALDPTERAKVHLMVANPPYVAEADAVLLSPELAYEPDDALFAGPSREGISGFCEVEHLVEGAAPWLAPGGIVAIEMAEHHVGPSLRAARRAGFERVEEIRDLADKPRGILAVAP